MTTKFSNIIGGGGAGGGGDVFLAADNVLTGNNEFTKPTLLSSASFNMEVGSNDINASNVYSLIRADFGDGFDKTALGKFIVDTFGSQYIGADGIVYDTAETLEVIYGNGIFEELTMIGDPSRLAASFYNYKINDGVSVDGFAKYTVDLHGQGILRAELVIDAVSGLATDISLASIIQTANMAGGTSDDYIATKKYVDDNSGGGGAPIGIVTNSQVADFVALKNTYYIAVANNGGAAITVTAPNDAVIGDEVWLTSTTDTNAPNISSFGAAITVMKPRTRLKLKLILLGPPAWLVIDEEFTGTPITSTDTAAKGLNFNASKGIYYTNVQDNLGSITVTAPAGAWSGDEVGIRSTTSNAPILSGFNGLTMVAFESATFRYYRDNNVWVKL